MSEKVKVTVDFKGEHDENECDFAMAILVKELDDSTMSTAMLLRGYSTPTTLMMVGGHIINSLYEKFKADGVFEGDVSLTVFCHALADAVEGSEVQYARIEKQPGEED